MNSDEALHGERRSKEGLSEMKQINVALAEKLAIARTRQLFERYIYKAPIPAELSKFSTEPPGKTRQCRATNCRKDGKGWTLKFRRRRQNRLPHWPPRDAAAPLGVSSCRRVRTV
jgi:hypothetical protein